VIRKLLTIAAVLALPALPASAAAAGLPSGFVGISPQNAANKPDYELMAESGIRSVRLPLFWFGVEGYSPFLAPPNWSGFDASVALAAESGMRVFPFVWGTPGWVARQPQVEPTRSRWALRAWTRFLRAAVRRYGAGGTFWRENPDLPYLPVRDWEVWNEENIVTFASHSDPERFARLLRASGRTIHSADRGAKAILGGLFGRPLQIPPNVGLGDFLDRVYGAGRVKPYFDGVALHPYVADARAMTPELRTMRRVMRRHGDGRTPIYLTELGWGSDSYETRWERGLQGQARELNEAFSILAAHRRSWRIGGVWWFSWADDPGAHCQFCDSSGLLTAKREAKPSWYRFNAWTGGDAGTVPRAKLGR
jgi:polysaccharide biosynthesis protein PslG